MDARSDTNAGEMVCHYKFWVYGRNPMQVLYQSNKTSLE